MTRYVGVKRTITVEYQVPVSSYPGMTEREIAEYERNSDDLRESPEIILENIVSVGVEVYFYDKDGENFARG